MFEIIWKGYHSIDFMESGQFKYLQSVATWKSNEDVWISVDLSFFNESGCVTVIFEPIGMYLLEKSV